MHEPRNNDGKELAREGHAGGVAVLQVSSWYHPEHQFGGPPGKIHALSRGLLNHGMSVSVLTFLSTDRNASRQVRYDGVDVQYLRWRGYGLRQWPRDLNVISAAVARADIVHCYGLYNFICPLAMRAAARAGKPCLLEPLGGFTPRARNLLAKRIYHRLFTHAMARQAVRVIATSGAEFEELRPLAVEPKLMLRRNGIDVEAYRTAASDRAFRQRLKLSDDVRVVLFIGRLSPIKNLEQLLQAFAAARLARTKLVLVGPGEADYERRLRELAQTLQLTDDVCFTGPLFAEEKRSALAAAALFVLPSLMESYGNAAAEAVAAGVPALVTDTCGIASAIHGRAGLAVNLGVQPLADGLRKMIDSPSFRDAHVSRRQEVLAEFAWEPPIQQMADTYRAILRSGDVSGPVAAPKKTTIASSP